MIKAVKCKKKFENSTLKKKHLKIQNFEKHHSALFVPVSLIYRFQLSTEKLEKWPFQGWEGRGYQTVNNGVLPRVLTKHYSPEKDQRSGAIGRVKVGCRSGAYVGYFAVKLEILC